MAGKKALSYGNGKSMLLVPLVVLLGLAYQAIQPPPPKICRSPGGPPITAPRIRLRGGRNPAYGEHGVLRDQAKHKFIFIHGFDSCRIHKPIAKTLSRSSFHNRRTALNLCLHRSRLQRGGCKARRIGRRRHRRWSRRFEKSFERNNLLVAGLYRLVAAA